MCRFCGRGTCREHTREKPFLFEAWEDGGVIKALVIEDALHCGVCQPRPDPVDVEFLRGGDDHDPGAKSPGA